MSQVDTLLQTAAGAARDESATPVERAQMLMQLAMGLQRRPKTPQHLARLGTPAEVAEAEMNLGLCLQHLAGAGRARLPDAIAAYQRALRTFDVRVFPVEFAILQNNLATAFLSTRSPLSEALAVQCFEQGLKAVNLIEHPVEYAMLQNNLGNALQTVGSRHAADNCLRALAAYDQALKVRTREARPVEHANTLANKANCLWALGRLDEAKACYQQAHALFSEHGEHEKAGAVAEAMAAA
jgi:tetratricopeptide (TPR) repeat protein